MKIKLTRDVKNEFHSLGKLSIDGEFYCYTVEDTERKSENKIYGKTAIPTGTYKVIINMSNRFKVLMPLLLNVPGFEGIRIHTGNTAEDTDGCIIVGLVRTPSGVGMSRICWTKLMERLKEKDINITIE